MIGDVLVGTKQTEREIKATLYVLLFYLLYITYDLMIIIYTMRG